jgi:N-acetylneuraminic acid mutarotase
MTERFKLLSEIGRGGMGVVWKATDEETGQIVALKVLREVYAEDPDYLARFERELELEKRIHSQNVVRVLGFGMRDRSPYLVLEYIDGPSLRGLLLDHGPYPWNEARNLLFQIAQGLADAHAAGVIHRDLKPSNILMGPGGVPKIADFGISKGLDLTRVTSTSALIGTPAYLAPEGPKDERSDLYSLGVIGYEILTGVVPFEGPSYQEVLLAHLRTPPDLNKLPEEARPVLAWLLAKDPNARPRNAGQLIRALSGIEGIPALGSIPEGMAPGVTIQAQPPTMGHYQTGTSWPGGATSGYVGPVGFQRPASRTPLIFGLVGVVAVVAVVGTAAALSIGRSGSGSPTAAPTSDVATSFSPALGGVASGDTSPTSQWVSHGPLAGSLWGQVVAQLNDGRVAIFSMCGQKNCKPATQQTWLFDPQTFQLTRGNSMTASQLNPAIAVFSNGADLMIAGGRDKNGPTSSAEILNLADGTFHALPPMLSPHDQGSATDLGGGRVLVIGGWRKYSGSSYIATSEAEIYDISTNQWTQVQGMSVARSMATATRLQDGRVLVAGGDSGWQGGAGAPNKQQVLKSAEIFDPQSNSWSSAGNMTVPRATQLAALLPNGHLLVAGGWSDGHESGLASTDEYTPGVGWSPGSMPSPHAQSRMVTLADGRLLVIGGVNTGGQATAETDLFDPASGTWQKVGDLPIPLYWSSAAALSGGGAVIVGGMADNDVPTGTIAVIQP